METVLIVAGVWVGLALLIGVLSRGFGVASAQADAQMENERARRMLARPVTPERIAAAAARQVSRRPMAVCLACTVIVEDALPETRCPDCGGVLRVPPVVKAGEPETEREERLGA